MAFLSTIFSPIIWIVTFLFTNCVAILFSLIALGLGAFLLSYYLYAFNSPSTNNSSKNSPVNVRKVSTIHESEEEADYVNPVDTTHELRRMRKRDWAKKLYTSFVADEGRRTPSDDSSGDSSEGRRKKRDLRRRHSTAGPLQMARDLIRRGSRGYFRQSSLLRDRLPMPPMEFFEPTALPEIPQNLQPEIFYILHNLKMLELPAEWKLNPREIEVRDFEKGEYIVKPGEQDNSIYVSIEGTLAVYIKHMEGKEYLVKKITAGNSFFSLLSMLDILMNVPSVFRTVSLKAAERCKVAKFPIMSFRDSFHEHPQQWTRPIQIVITRLLHVTMTTLHQYMGLSSELMKRRRDMNVDDKMRQMSGASLKAAASIKKNRHQSTEVDQADMQALGKKWFSEQFELGPEGPALLDGKVTIETYDENTVIVEQGSEEEQLMLILTGTLRLIQRCECIDEEPLFDEEPDEEDQTVSRLIPKDMIGGLQLLTNEPSFYTVKTCSKCVVAKMSKQDFNELLEMKPQIYLPVAHSVLRRLSPFLRGVDFALDWVLVDSGQAVYRAGDNADSLFVVLSGRLRSVEKKTVVEEFGRGDVLGMMEVLQKKPRSTTVMAVRFSQLARVPEGLLNFIKLQFPQVGFRLVQLLGQYYSSLSRRAPFVPGSTIKVLDSAGDPMSHIKNLHTIAVVPASADVPLVPFTCELYHALSANLRVLRLSSQKVASCLDNSVLEKQADFRLMHWLNVQEDTYPLVIYECDYTATNWTRRCLRQADAILVVAMGHRKPQKSSLLRDLLSMNQDGVRTNKELILLWPEGTVSPTGTYEWLKNSYFSGHHHIRAPKRMLQWSKKPSRKLSRESPCVVPEADVIDYYQKNVFWTVDHLSDFARLARILTGNAIGLVLGGGGARGAAHVGVLKALREQGIPVDIVGGTSIGSFIGGIYADTPDERVEERAKYWFDSMTSLWRKILDLTYAHSAMFTGAQFNKSIQDVFGDQEIENLWIPYFCISTDITTSEMRVHRTGPLWAYCRASMSLAGYLPPLCDPQDGHLLLDGGYVNNLPADVMRSMGAKLVIAVDVGAVEETNLYNYGDSLSGLWVLFQKLNPFSHPPRILNMEEIQSRLAYVSCVRQLETVKKAPYCQYLRPAIEPFKTLDFGKFNTIMAVGYDYGKDKITELTRSSTLRTTLFGDNQDRTLRRQFSRREKNMDLERTSSFTDLAAAMSKVPVVRPVLRQTVSESHNYITEDILDELMFSDNADADSEFSQSENDITETTDDEDDDLINLRGTTPRPLTRKIIDDGSLICSHRVLFLLKAKS
ncbi:unnamed protein product [Auanema sp. JU1783]|nr:unnamed protein product [Auanema sp. JU1783]